MVTIEGGEVMGGPDGGVPLAVAESWPLPWVRSAAVDGVGGGAGLVAGARVLLEGHAGREPPLPGRAPPGVVHRPTSVRVVVPVLVTKKRVGDDLAHALDVLGGR